MYSNCCSGNFSSCSLGSSLRYPGYSCGFSYPSNLVYSTDLCSPSTSLYSGCQETCYKPSSCGVSCAVSNPCPTSCYQPRTSVLCSPCQPAYTKSLGCGTRSTCSLGYGARSCYSLGCGVTGFRSLGCGTRVSPFLGYGSGLCCPSYFPSRSCQPSCYRPTCGSGFYCSTC
ncbi:keratin-associated protein 13-1-like [Tamandua tetradactyla]|uniref:keratin-associated protein 13-1-like n=1 Tax=Tamandua tetradactyla TaxID=48850 RepID=UPI0040544E66